MMLYAIWSSGNLYGAQCNLRVNHENCDFRVLEKNQFFRMGGILQNTKTRALEQI